MILYLCGTPATIPIVLCVVSIRCLLYTSNGQIIGGNSTDRALMSFIVDCDACKAMNKEEVRNFNAFDAAKKYSSVTLVDVYKRQL